MLVIEFVGDKNGALLFIKLTLNMDRLSICNANVNANMQGRYTKERISTRSSKQD